MSTFEKTLVDLFESFLPLPVAEVDELEFDEVITDADYILIDD